MLYQNLKKHFLIFMRKISLFVSSIFVCDAMIHNDVAATE